MCPTCAQSFDLSLTWCFFGLVPMRAQSLDFISSWRSFGLLCARKFSTQYPNIVAWFKILTSFYPLFLACFRRARKVLTPFCLRVATGLGRRGASPPDNPWQLSKSGAVGRAGGDHWERAFAPPPCIPRPYHRLTLRWNRGERVARPLLRQRRRPSEHPDTNP